jgi:two-component system phosphate regulon sensor histidine kinase PhoR
MDILLILVVGIAILLAILFGWRYLVVRRQMDEFARQVRRSSEENPRQHINFDLPEIDPVTSAVNTLTRNYNLQYDLLDTERSRLAAVLAQMTDGVLIADSAGMIQYANSAAERLFGGKLRDHSVTTALRHHQLIEAWHKCQENGEMQVESVELPNRRQFLQLIVIPDQHAPGGTLLMVQDMTRVRRLETVRRDFISNISHELRTPLASLKALTETLQDGAISDPEAAGRFIGRISIEVDALTQMAQELLDLSRIESGQVDLERKLVAPKKLLISAAERMRLQAERAGLSLEVVCPDELPEVQADAPRIEQVLVNLIHNAVKFTSPGGQVELSADIDPASYPKLAGKAAGGVVRFSVRDSGVGIPSDDVPRIFERFYRVDKSRSGGGTGLGLSISRHLVDSHGGRIWAESREGEGSVFYFTIPAQVGG